MGKLVRDGIPDIIRADGGEPVVRTLDRLSNVVALLDKIGEEERELRAAIMDGRTSCSDDVRDPLVLDELADLHDLILALAVECGFDHTDVVSAATRKTEARGGFVNRTFLVSQ